MLILIFVSVNSGFFSFRGRKAFVVLDEIRTLERIPEPRVVVQSKWIKVRPQSPRDYDKS